MSRHNRFHPYLILLLGLAVILIYPVSVVLGRIEPDQAKTKLAQGGYITFSAPEKAIQVQSNAGLYLETNQSFESSQLWLVSLPDLTEIQPLFSIRHAVGYPPEFRACPARDALAATIIPPGSSEYKARILGGEIWWIDLLSASTVYIAPNAGSKPYVSPGCTHIVFSRLSPLPQPESPHIPFRTDLILVNLSTYQQRSILSDSKNYGVEPLGWDASGSVFFYYTLSMQGEYNVHALDIKDLRPVSSWNLNAYQSIRQIELSPTGTHLLFEGIKDGEIGVYNMPLSLTKPLNQPSMATLTRYSMSNMPLIKTIWSSDGQHILTYSMTNQQKPANGQIWNSQTRVQVQNVISRPEGQWLPNSVSKNAEWIIWREYPNDYPALAIASNTSDTWLTLPRLDPNHYVSWVGWWEK